MAGGALPGWADPATQDASTRNADSPTMVLRLAMVVDTLRDVETAEQRSVRAIVVLRNAGAEN
jgi:hypothetical protein